MGGVCVIVAARADSSNGQTPPFKVILEAVHRDLAGGEARVDHRSTVWFWWIFYSSSSFSSLLIGKIQKNSLHLFFCRLFSFFNFIPHYLILFVFISNLIIIFFIAKYFGCFF
jgi:hypothetical protein